MFEGKCINDQKIVFHEDSVKDHFKVKVNLNDDLRNDLAYFEARYSIF